MVDQFNPMNPSLMNPLNQANYNAPSLFNQDAEKSWTDKLLGAKEIEEIKEIIKKPLIFREDTHNLMLLTNAIESKLVNLDEHERRELGNFLIFLGNRIRMMDVLFDIQEKIENGTYQIVDASRRKFLETYYKMSHNIKYLFTVFTFPSRTSLSLDAFAFKNFVKTQYDISYSGLGSMDGYAGQQQKPGFLGGILKGGNKQ